jgi:catechol 2,3-dioxygenase-like lactoylglutathione lyase family enzyme
MASPTLVSTDLDASQDFYENEIGLKPSSDTIKNHLVFESGDGTTVLIYGRGSGNYQHHRAVPARMTAAHDSRMESRASRE